MKPMNSDELGDLSPPLSAGASLRLQGGRTAWWPCDICAAKGGISFAYAHAWAEISRGISMKQGKRLQYDYLENNFWILLLIIGQ